MDRLGGMSCIVKAAELGYRDAQFWCGENVWTSADWQRYRWWGLAAARGYYRAVLGLQEAATEQMRLIEEGSAVARLLFELGAAFRGHVEVPEKRVFCEPVSEEDLQAALRCVELHDECVAHAKDAIRIWLLIGRRLNVAKDIRHVIAKLLWAQSWTWSKVVLQER
jgi:hypothetical protein